VSSFTFKKKKSIDKPLPEGIADLDPKVLRVLIDALKPNPKNARTHNRKQKRAMAASLRKFGYINPILVDASNTIIAGHCRWEALKELGVSEVPVLVLEHLTDDEIRAYAIADNQLPALASWDKEILATELHYLVELGFDVDVTGFEAPEIDFLIESQLTGPGSSLADAVPDVDEAAPVVSREGDLWKLGKHRLLCGNALETSAYKILLGQKRVLMVFTDMPYNVSVDGNVCGSGAIKHAEFLMASGEMTRTEFQSFIAKALSNIQTVCRDGAVIFACMDWRSIDLLVGVGREVFKGFLNVCIWNKTNAGMGSLYRSQHEMVAVFKSGTKPHVNNVELGKHGRNRSNVWTYAGVNSLRSDRLEELEMHPTVKPVALVADAIRDCSKRGSAILDPFVGSGTTIIAAEETGRVAYAMELDPKYVDVAIRRWEMVTGERAVHAESGATFAEIEQQRLDAAGHIEEEV